VALRVSAWSCATRNAFYMADSIEILPAGWRDWLGVRSLEQACFGPDAWSGLDLFLALVGPSLRLKVVSEKTVVGFAMGEPHPSEGYAWIATLGIAPAFQRRGLGARLLAATEARLTPPLLKLTVRQSNGPAIQLYEKAGYRPVRTWENYYAGGEAGIVMEKQRG
jgi:[ribosomal protein S18]-alanine N-acetyltransferase